MLSRVQENLIATLIPAEGRTQSRPRTVRLPVELGQAGVPWGGLVSVLTTAIPAYAQIRAAEVGVEQARAETEAAKAELEKIRLAATPETKLKIWLPWIGGGVLILTLIILALRKGK